MKILFNNRGDFTEDWEGIEKLLNTESFNWLKKELELFWPYKPQPTTRKV